VYYFEGTVIDAYQAPSSQKPNTLRLYDSKGRLRRFDLPHVCKQTYIESRPLLFEGATLRIGRTHGFENFSSRVRAADLNAIQSLRIGRKIAEVLTCFNKLQRCYGRLYPQVRRVLCLLDLLRDLGGVKNVVLESRPLQESGVGFLSNLGSITGVRRCLGDRDGWVEIVYDTDD
jgi:hypothetical protein